MKKKVSPHMKLLLRCRKLKSFIFFFIYNSLFFYPKKIIIKRKIEMFCVEPEVIIFFFTSIFSEKSRTKTLDNNKFFRTAFNGRAERQEQE